MSSNLLKFNIDGKQDHEYGSASYWKQEYEELLKDYKELERELRRLETEIGWERDQSQWGR